MSSIVIHGRIISDLEIIESTNPKFEQLNFKVTSRQHSERQERTLRTPFNYFKNELGYFNVQLNVEKGKADQLIKNNMFAKGHTIKLSNMMIIQEYSLDDNNQEVKKNVFKMKSNTDLFSCITFRLYPYATAETNAKTAQLQAEQKIESKKFNRHNNTLNRNTINYYGVLTDNAVIHDLDNNEVLISLSLVPKLYTSIDGDSNSRSDFILNMTKNDLSRYLTFNSLNKGDMIQVNNLMLLQFKENNQDIHTSFLAFAPNELGNNIIIPLIND